jgi:hypothetical protein
MELINTKQKTQPFLLMPMEIVIILLLKIYKIIQLVMPAGISVMLDSLKGGGCRPKKEVMEYSAPQEDNYGIWDTKPVIGNQLNVM